MKFLKVKVRQREEGTPGFVEAEDLEVTINLDSVTIFNQSLDDKNTTFVRLNCGAMLEVVIPYSKFSKMIDLKK